MNPKFKKTKWLIFFFIFVFSSVSNSQNISIGAKNFNEGYLLSEILAQLLEIDGFKVERKFNLGGTLICFEALKNKEIDLYPEYTGTIAEQILQSDKKLTLPELRDKMKDLFDMEISDPFGFNNTYALAIKKETAETYSLKQISDLQDHPNLNFAFSYEFLKRKDGWENLAVSYNLSQKPVGIEHGLSYQALEEGKVDLIDIYSTDGEITRYDLHILDDNYSFFPRYMAVVLFNAGLNPETRNLIKQLGYTITDQTMQELNARVVFEKESYQQVARSFLTKMKFIDSETKREVIPVYKDIFDKTIVHLELTAIAVLAALLFALPLGILIYRYAFVSRPVLYFSGLLQTIPSIALLALMIPLFGIGVLPAIVALFLYALLPILRNTTIALFSIDPLLKKVATGIGLTWWQRLRFVEIPLATPTIFAGIKTAAVISIGTATLAAFIGAGGLGEFIVTGLALNNTTMILKGAIPAAILAILVEFLFELIEKIFVPKHLQQKIGN